MICEPCRVAGAYNKITNDGDKAPSPAKMHAKCHAPTTCPCQHRTGQHIKQVAK